MGLTKLWGFKRDKEVSQTDDEKNIPHRGHAQRSILDEEQHWIKSEEERKMKGTNKWDRKGLLKMI